MTVNDRQSPVGGGLTHAEAQAMAAAVAEVVRISTEFAEACADCEHLRLSEPYPQTKWQAAWNRRLALASRWQEAAKRLTTRDTDPPEQRATR